MIEWSRVAELRDEIGYDDFFEVVDLFIEEVAEGIGTLNGKLSASEIERTLHFLKGSALNLGFTEFAARCHQGEVNAAKGNTDQINLPGITESFLLSKNEFLAALKTRFVT